MLQKLSEFDVIHDNLWNSYHEKCFFRRKTCTPHEKLVHFPTQNFCSIDTFPDGGNAMTSLDCHKRSSSTVNSVLVYIHFSKFLYKDKRGGLVVKWSKALVCQPYGHGFESQWGINMWKLKLDNQVVTLGQSLHTTCPWPCGRSVTVLTSDLKCP